MPNRLRHARRARAGHVVQKPAHGVPPFNTLSSSLAVRRELPQPLQPFIRPAAVHGRSRHVDARLNGRGAAGNEQGETALQRQRRQMRTAVTACEYLEQCREVRARIAADQIAGLTYRKAEVARIDFAPTDRTARNVESQERTEKRGFIPILPAVL